MSLIAMQGGATGTGTVTLLAPITNTNRTLTLPDATGTVAVQGGTGVGKVLQVVNATTSTSVSNSTTTYADSGLTATITPTSASSTILVFVTQSCLKTNGSASSGVNIKLFRGATDLGRRVYAQSFTNSALEFYSMAAFQYLDSPATTSATIYKTQFSNSANAAAAVVQPDNLGVSTITLMEIAA
jgi:hypothetical protein